MAERTVKKVMEELDCRICLDTYKDPKLLQCFHVYCTKCLKRLVDRDRQGKLFISCPECRQVTATPAGVAGLKSAFHFIRLLEIMQKHRNEVCTFCADHADEKLKLYCETCQELICSKCVIQDATHYNHSHVVVEKAVAKYKKEMNMLSKQIEEKLENINLALEEVDARHEKLTDLLVKAQSFPGNNASPLFQQITESKLHNLLAQKEYVKFDQVQIKNRWDYIKLSIDSNDDPSLLAMKGMINEMKNLAHTSNPLSEHLVYSGSADEIATLQSTEMLIYQVHTSEENYTQKLSAKSTTEAIFASPAFDKTELYSSAILRLPVAFYFNALTGIVLMGDLVEQRKFPGTVLPPTMPSHVSRPRQPVHDSFRPPHGPPVEYLTSVGYGREVGLSESMQEVHDPLTMRSIILDHANSKIILKDLRVQDKRIVVRPEPTYIFADSYEWNIPLDLCTDGSVVEQTGFRARSKPVGCMLFLQGKDGHHGVDGLRGTFGPPGFPGMPGDTGIRHGQHGGNGVDGGQGWDGGEGEDGKNGGNAVLHLSGSAEQLHVKGTKEFTAHLGGTTSEQILLVNCRGGNGGRGGYGGNGGGGGLGGNGGVGVHMYVKSYVGNGIDGNGGNGGNGGGGGRGGNAGTSGTAGDGGNCLIQTSDAKLLILVEADCRPGDPGAKALGGESGLGGLPGVGGQAGRLLTTSISSFRLIGRNGLNGNYGAPGARGRDGIEGKSGINGGILWVVKDGEKTQQASTRYDAKVEGVKVVPTQNDGIFEPNERIFTSIIICNTGGLDLPAGAIVSILSTGTTRFKPTHFSTPHDIKAGHKYSSPFQFQGRIMDLAPPNKPGCQSFTAELQPSVTLLGRPFEKSSMKIKLNIHYPVQLGILSCPKTMSRGEMALICIEVKNLSRIPYGNCDGSGGRIVLQLHFDSRIIPLGQPDQMAAYEITHNPNFQDSTFVEIFEIPPKSTIVVGIQILMEREAELFDSCIWQVDLRLRDKLIEYNHQSIQVIPAYNHQKQPADVLLVTSELMTRNEFVFWERIFENRGASFDVWDISLNQGLSLFTDSKHYENSWHGRYTGKLILYAHCNLELLTGKDIVEHFHGVDFSGDTLLELNSSLILFMPVVSSPGNEAAVLKHLASVGARKEIPENSYGGRHLSKTSLDKDPPPYVSWENKFFHQLQTSNPSQAVVLLERHVKIVPTTPLHYSYGSIDVRTLPILKSSKFLQIDGVVLGHEDIPLPSFKIPVASTYGQTFLAVLYGLSISAKLKLLKRESHEACQPIWFTYNQCDLSEKELAMIVLAWEIAEELFSCSGEAHRMKEFYIDVLSNTYTYLACGHIIVRGLKLIDREFKKLKAAGLKHYRVMQAYQKIAEMSGCINKKLLEFGIEKSKMKDDLLSLDCLQDGKVVHRWHQTNKWNFT